MIVKARLLNMDCQIRQSVDAFMVVCKQYYPTFFSGDDGHRTRIVVVAFDSYDNNSWSCIADFHRFTCGEFLVVRRGEFS